MTVQPITLRRDPGKQISSCLALGAKAHQKQHEIADVARHPPSGEDEGEDVVLRISGDLWEPGVYSGGARTRTH
eukprot:7844048-Alexandrium_andersonii.AAC.1